MENKELMDDKLQYDLSQAIILATKKHKGQVDKGGKPYILHPLAVMNNVDSIEEKIVAVLHDILEDTDVTMSDLRNYYGFNENIILAIICLTRWSNETYDMYIRRVGTNKLATTVKLADLKHNMDLTRLKRKPKTKDLKRVEKYKKAYDYLCNRY